MDQDQTARTADPDVVLQILTDPDSNLYPSAIGIFCDTCHIAEVGDFLVSDEDSQDERFEIARNHLRGNGWSCTEAGDYCPTCLSARTGVEAVHACPPGNSALTPCCGKTPFELSRTDRLTYDQAEITCPAARTTRES